MAIIKCLRRYIIVRIGQDCGSGIVSFSSGSRLDAASRPGNSPKASRGLTAQRRRRRPGKVCGECPRAQAPPAQTATATVNVTFLLSALVDMAANTPAPGGELPGDPDAAIRQLYSHYATALHRYLEQLCPDQASADDVVQETCIRAWRRLP